MGHAKEDIHVLLNPTPKDFVNGDPILQLNYSIFGNC